VGTYLFDPCCLAMDARPANPNGAVLIVEDEPFTRIMASDVISSAGFAVLEAGNAVEALSILEAQADVRVVFTDVDMPGPLDGLELAGRIGQLWPSIGIVISSGHFSHLARAPAKYGFLPKPYSGPELLRQIREAAGTSVTTDPQIALCNVA
jgi:two-component system, response regulator PdtaR